MTERIILHGLDNAHGKIEAARAALSYGLEAGRWMGVRLDGRFYSVTRNKGSVTVRSAEAPTDNSTKEG